MVTAANQEAARAEGRVEEAETAAVEGAKLALGSLVPSSLEPLLRQFVKVTADAFAKTVVKEWFRNHRSALAEMRGDPAALKSLAAGFGGSLGRVLRGTGASSPFPSSENIAARVKAEAAQVEAQDAREAAEAGAKAEARETFIKEFGMSPEEFERRSERRRNEVETGREIERSRLREIP